MPVFKACLYISWLCSHNPQNPRLFLGSQLHIHNHNLHFHSTLPVFFPCEPHRTQHAASKIQPFSLGMSDSIILSTSKTLYNTPKQPNDHQVTTSAQDKAQTTLSTQHSQAKNDVAKEPRLSARRKRRAYKKTYPHRTMDD